MIVGGTTELFHNKAVIKLNKFLLGSIAIEGPSATAVIRVEGLLTVTIEKEEA